MRDRLCYLVALGAGKSTTKQATSSNQPTCNLTISPTDLWHNHLSPCCVYAGDADRSVQLTAISEYCWTVAGGASNLLEEFLVWFEIGAFTCIITWQGSWRIIKCATDSLIWINHQARMMRQDFMMTFFLPFLNYKIASSLNDSFPLQLEVRLMPVPLSVIRSIWKWVSSIFW
ncbi:uncharacterized protein [Typha latifolia]|uniref:uncharacterized protein n=1 Tax=Typha latifolia TaxID=4733 RepID=UPI003C2D710B